MARGKSPLSRIARQLDSRPISRAPVPTLWKRGAILNVRPVSGSAICCPNDVNGRISDMAETGRQQTVCI